MVLVCALVAFHLQAYAYRPPPKESMHAVRLGLGRERRALWRVGVQGHAHSPMY